MLKSTIIQNQVKELIKTKPKNSKKRKTRDSNDPRWLSFYDSEEEKESFISKIKSVHDVLCDKKPKRMKKSRNRNSATVPIGKTQASSIPSQVLKDLSYQRTPKSSIQFSKIGSKGSGKKNEEYPDSSKDSVKPCIDVEKERSFLQFSPERSPYNPLRGSAEKVLGSATRKETRKNKNVRRLELEPRSIDFTNADTNEAPLQQYMFTTGAFDSASEMLSLPYRSTKVNKIATVKGFSSKLKVQSCSVVFTDGQIVPVFFKKVPLGQDAQQYQDKTDHLYGTSRAVNPIVQTVKINSLDYLIQRAFTCDFQEFIDLKLENQDEFNAVVLHKVGLQLLRLILKGKNIHGDVKPQNIVLRPNGDEDFQVRFIDTEDTTQTIEKEDSTILLTRVTSYYIHSSLRQTDISKDSALFVSGVSYDLYAFFKMVKELCPRMLQSDVYDSRGEILSSLTTQNLQIFLDQVFPSCGAKISNVLEEYSIQRTVAK